MTFLVDANILSEPTKPAPAVRVIEWLRQNEREIAIDPIVLGEIRFGIHLLPDGRRRRQLEEWFTQGISKILCLTWDSGFGLRWARLLAELRSRGQNMPIKDSLIAASALQANLTVATRNISDFKKTGVGVINPFD